MSTIRIDPTKFRQLDLRCHALLSDVPLDDVWAVPLKGGGPGRTMKDVRRLMRGSRRRRSNMAVDGLFWLRWRLGRMFKWDDDGHDDPAASYVHRLTEIDRLRSEVPPGTREGAFRVLYVFPHEAVSEIRNATVHGFLALALTRREQGYDLYIGVYVKPASWLTGVYMAVIDPFRRFIVYPALGRHVQQAWLRTFNRARA